MEVLGLVNIPLWLLFIIFILVTLYIYLTWNYNYWKSQGVPGPRPYPLIGTMLGTFKDGFVDDDSKCFKKYGKIVAHYAGRQPMLAVYDLDLLKQILVKDAHNFIDHQSISLEEYPLDKMMSVLKGDHWRHVRNLLSPTFSGRKIRRMMVHINRCSENLVKHLAEKAKNNETFNAREFLGAFTMDVIASTAFGIQLDSQADKNNEFIKNAKKITDLNVSSLAAFIIITMPNAYPYFVKWFGMSLFEKDVNKFFCDIVDKTIQTRQEENVNEPDFLQLMMNAHKDFEGVDDDEEGNDTQNKNQEQPDKPRRGLTKEELLGQGWLFFIAGYDTVGITLSWLSYCLAINPECQEKVQQEIDDIVEGQDVLTYEMINKMTYLDMCINETLRLYPPAGRTDRQSTDEHDLEFNDIIIPKGTPIGIPVQTIHYDPEYWPDPEKFDPERFTPEEKAKRHPMAYLPFGSGPRQCIGMRLAFAELRTSMMHLLRRFTLVACDQTQIPLKQQKNKPQPVEPGIILKIVERNA